MLHHQCEMSYVHCSGGMFVLIEDSQTTSPTMKEASFVYSTKKKSSSQLRKNYIARQASRTMPSSNAEYLVFILLDYLHRCWFVIFAIKYIWNITLDYLTCNRSNIPLSKKWRTSHTGDEAFQDRILADFRAFCSNKDDRLKEYWNDYRLDNPVWYFK
jgi:hypothetical protein